MKDIVIIGSGGFGREVKLLIDDINRYQKQYNLLGFYDDAFTEGQIVNGCKVLGNLDDLKKITSPIAIAIGIGNPEIKKKIAKEFTESHFDFPTLIHPSAIVGNDDVVIGRGSLICAGCIITCNIEIGDFVTLNLVCTVGHDTIVGKYVSVMPGVNISGEVSIEEGVYIGTGAKIINMLTIGKYSIIGAGAVVSKSIPENCTAVGIPAKPIKFHA